ncbi:MAG: hypothetical protein L6R41_002043 [Letrouitia leprolyta]|nr:MAG: hypothetical protein L6R41_002043 [Letrouitia leprolyta]
MSSSSQNSEEQRSPIPNPPCSSPEDLPLPGGNGRTDVALEPKLITVKDEPAAMGTSQQAQIQQAQIQQAQIQQAQIQQAQIQQANIHKAALFPSLDVTSLPIASSSLNPSSEDDQSRLEGRSSQSEHPSRAGAPSAPVEISSARSASLPPLVESVLDRTTAAIYPSVESIESQWTPTRAEARRVHVSQHRTRLIKIVNATYAVCRSEELDEEARSVGYGPESSRQ